MLTFRDFYRMRKYSNMAWRGGFSDEDVAEQAHDDYEAYDRMEINSDCAHDIVELYKGLAEDIYYGWNDEDGEWFVHDLKEEFKAYGIDASFEPSDEFRICSCCGERMYEGFYVEDLEYYCGKECLHKRYTDEEYFKMYEEGYACWTHWY